ncbi:flagellar export protein FliJ [Nocardioides sp. CER19]|uniref:flagellar export protein FliJ n=1 Tax=Nocardioides sp. CER19 TaxID=3038538 RepID=UPI002449D17A|nr:flagellar export protein FliJ [Nocardioides sp. CER19]MDH2414627.1 flagellar export protein FliJ [Nocardioides sp. CER19]
MTTTHDPGLHAVARVRGVREQDSLIALQRALTAQREHEERLAQLRDQLTAAAALEADILGGSGTPGALLTLRMTLGHLAESTRLAREELASAEVLTDAARDRWERDKSDLSAVEQLLERRTTERRHEARRAEDRQTDETAAQGWLRRTTGDHR